MKTWQNFAGGTGTAITTWNYDAYRGWLNSKDYADPTTGAAGTVGPDYTYTAAGRMATRLWARGSPRVTTTYAYCSGRLPRLRGFCRWGSRRWHCGAFMGWFGPAPESLPL